MRKNIKTNYLRTNNSLKFERNIILATNDVLTTQNIKKQNM